MMMTPRRTIPFSDLSPRPAQQPDLFTKRVRKPPPAPEFHTHCMVADTLRSWASPGWRWTHLPLGEERPHQWVKDKTGTWQRISSAGARLKRMGLQPGWADFLLLSPDGGVPHFLELKRARRGKRSLEQEDFAAWCESHRVAYAVATGYSEALEILKGWGAVRTNVRVSA
jgi:hypothetical protein